MSDVFDYIDGFYHRVCRHSHLDLLSSLAFEQLHWKLRFAFESGSIPKFGSGGGKAFFLSVFKVWADYWAN